MYKSILVVLVVLALLMLLGTVYWIRAHKTFDGENVPEHSGENP